MVGGAGSGNTCCAASCAASGAARTGARAGVGLGGAVGAAGTALEGFEAEVAPNALLVLPCDVLVVVKARGILHAVLGLGNLDGSVALVDPDDLGRDQGGLSAEKAELDAYVLLVVLLVHEKVVDLADLAPLIVVDGVVLVLLFEFPQAFFAGHLSSSVTLSLLFFWVPAPRSLLNIRPRRPERLAKLAQCLFSGGGHGVARGERQGPVGRRGLLLGPGGPARCLGGRDRRLRGQARPRIPADRGRRGYGGRGRAAGPGGPGNRRRTLARRLARRGAHRGRRCQHLLALGPRHRPRRPPDHPDPHVGRPQGGRNRRGPPRAPRRGGGPPQDRRPAPLELLAGKALVAEERGP